MKNSLRMTGLVLLLGLIFTNSTNAQRAKPAPRHEFMFAGSPVVLPPEAAVASGTTFVVTDVVVASSPENAGPNSFLLAYVTPSVGERPLLAIRLAQDRTHSQAFVTGLHLAGPGTVTVRCVDCVGSEGFHVTLSGLSQ